MNTLENNTKQKKIKLLDCTIRDGGLVNDSNFDDATVSAVYAACADAQIDYIEIGFKNERKFFSPQTYGKWRFCDEDDIRRILEDSQNFIKTDYRPTLGVLADAGKSDTASYPQKKDSVVDLVRCAFYEHQLEDAIKTINIASDKGYKTAFCMMAASVVSEKRLDEALQKMSKTDADIIYIMDSFGAMLPSDIEEYCAFYKERIGKKMLGIHVHNNMQCAFANTIKAIECGADIADSTFAGMGKGAGNCNTEMLAMHLKKPQSSVHRILEVIEKHIQPLRKNLEWGFAPHYMITGIKNSHPRPAMDFAKTHKISLAEFYDEIEKNEKTKS